MRPSPIISSGNKMTIIFHSDGDTNGNGFSAIWHPVEKGTFFLGKREGVTQLLRLKIIKLTLLSFSFSVS